MGKGAAVGLQAETWANPRPRLGARLDAETGGSLAGELRLLVGRRSNRDADLSGVVSRSLTSTTNVDHIRARHVFTGHADEASDTCRRRIVSI